MTFLREKMMNGKTGRFEKYFLKQNAAVFYFWARSKNSGNPEIPGKSRKIPKIPGKFRKIPGKFRNPGDRDRDRDMKTDLSLSKIWYKSSQFFSEILGFHGFLTIGIFAEFFSVSG